MTGMKCPAVLTIFWALAPLLFGQASGSSGQPPNDLLEKRMKALAPDAINCGRVGVRADPQKASNCALDAFKNRKPFQVRYDLQGIDSSVAVGWVGTADGAVIAISFDGDPMGGGGTSETRQRVYEKACPQPVKLFLSPGRRLNCFPPDPNAKPDVMSPTYQPY
jgi:hypothetical protein